MPNILMLGYTTEGTTDKRFFDSIIERTFQNLLYQSPTEIEIFKPVYLTPPRNTGFIEKVIHAAREATEIGAMILCVHTDADADNDKSAFEEKIHPAFERVFNLEDELLCKNLCAVVPVYMTEAWMLADKELFKQEIYTEKTDQDLGIDHYPETYNNPKKVIMDAIRIAQQDMPKKSAGFDISDLYQPLGQQIPLLKLGYLESYKKFVEAARNALIQMNYLH